MAPAPKMAALPNFLLAFLSHSPCWASVSTSSIGGKIPGKGIHVGARDGQDDWGLSLSVNCFTGRVGKKGTFGVLSLLLSRLSLFFGVRHFDSLVCLYKLFSEGLQTRRCELAIVCGELREKTSQRGVRIDVID